MSERAVFLDRDDTLIEDPGYINSPEQVKLLEGAAEALMELRKMGYKLVVVTNQSAVARGIVSEKVLREIHERMKSLLGEKGAFVDRIYYCPYHPEGAIAKYRKESELRKPNPGMLLQAAEDMDIDTAESWLIGNSMRDVEAGLRAGCRTILIERSYEHKGPKRGERGPDHKSVNIKEAVNIIKKHHRSGRILADERQAGQAEDEPVTGDLERAGVATESEPESPSGPPPAAEVAPEPPPPAEPRPTAEAEQKGGAAESAPAHAAPGSGGDRHEQLLTEILDQLKTAQRKEVFGEFSTMRLMAGVVQVLVPFCLVITVGFLISPNRQDSAVLIALGFAAVLQLMALTFYVMQGRR
jgi:D-glycero-D-manno-heptose 1,7-bisphosphate phosphatase